MRQFVGIFLAVVCLATTLGAQRAEAPTAAPAAGSTARHPEQGRTIARSYPPEIYDGAGSQNWAVIQDRRGVIYVGSTSAILEYDGVSWRKILTPTRTTGRTLAMDGDGRIWVGAVGDLGYLAPDSNGQMQFVSLLDKLPDSDRVFEDVWRVFVAPEGVYFQTQRALFRWANDTFRIWKPTGRIFNRAQFANDTLYIGQTDRPLQAMKGDVLVDLPGTERIGKEASPVVLPFDDKRLLMGTRTDGLFLYDGAALTPFPTAADDAIRKYQLYRGFILADQTIALTTTAGGMFIVDRGGRLLDTIDQQDGLLSPSVYNIFPDREGGLWLALSVGLVRVETRSSFSLFAAPEGLTASPADVRRHNGTLYIAHGQGVQYLEPRAGSTPRIATVTGVGNQCWAFFEFKDASGRTPPQLLLAASDGVFQIAGPTARPIVQSVNRSFGAFVFAQSRLDPSRVWVGLADGLASLRWDGTRWLNEGRLAGVADQVRSLFQEKDGTLWLGTQSSGLVRVRGADADPHAGTRPERGSLERFGPGQGVPAGGATVSAVADRPYFAVLGKNLRLDDDGVRLIEDRRFEVIARDPNSDLMFVSEGPGGEIYVTSGRDAAVLRRQQDGSYVTDRQVFSRTPVELAGAFYPEADGVLWFGSRNQLVRLDTRQFVRTTPPFSALVRGVTAHDHDAPSVLPLAGNPPSLAPTMRSLRFEFAAPSFLNESTTEFQSRLEGLDADWSNWSRETRRDYTNLGFGDYRFRVRARNELSNLSEEGVFAFTILPPWYRTWPAYAGYLLAFGLLVFAADRIQRRRLLSNERERARFAEARLRAEAAEALARTESEGKKQVELLSNIGREITASLDFDTIFGKLYERVNELVDAGVFGVGLYHAERNELEYRLAIERGQRYAPYTRDTSNRNQLPVWCIEHRAPVVINDLRAEIGNYVSHYDEQSRPLEDGSMSKEPQSIIYLPLIAQDRVLGIITIQSFAKNAYTEHDLNVLQSLASYTAIALDNANAYRQLNEQEHEIRRLFEEAEKARATAEEADAAKSAFLSTVSHELRTPLTSVLGFAKIIKKRLEDRIFPLVPRDDRKIAQTVTQIDENLNVVVSEGERLTKLIDDVLDLAKIEAGKLEWHMEPVTVPDIIDRATAATSSLFEQKGLRLAKEVAADLPTVTGDRDRLIQVVINLISNAVKFTNSGSVTCRAHRRGGDLVISVIDTGMGIAPDDQPKVFERFKQVGDTLTDKPKGTGLGLPICREIVEHHGGQIWVESAIGEGSIFSFTLPVPDGAGASVPGGPIELAALIRQLRDRVVLSTPRNGNRAPRILVVDDEANIRELLTQEFTEAGYQVTTASNGREAIACVRAERPDLIVLDVMMPEMNGFDVAAVVKNDPLTMDIPIIILSIVQDRERGFRIGVDRYFTKPIDTDLLFKEVGSLIEQKKSHRRVLVVDEDASTVKSLSDVLTARGYTVTEARADDLLSRAVATQPDIILLNAMSSARSDAARMLRFEKGLENVLFLVYS